MSAESLDTSVGARLWYEGAAWTVVELDGSNALLRAGDQLEKVHAPSLVGTAESLELPTVQDARAELDAVVLASLSNKQLDGVYREAKVFDELILATSGAPVNDRYEVAADALAISVRTAYRRGLRYADQGIVGLHRPAQTEAFGRPTVAVPVRR